MDLLITVGMLSLFAGLILLCSERLSRRIADSFNATVAQIDGAVMAIRIPAGIFLVIVGGWIISVAGSSPRLWWLFLVGTVIIFFGLLYLFLPNWLETRGRNADQILLSADEIVIKLRQGFGIVLIGGAIYIFYAAMLIR